MKVSKSAATLGRPREFDSEEALEKAMRLFWRKGYEGTTYADLTAAIGITKPSLYATFGNKEQLFRKVLAKYGEGQPTANQAALELPTAFEVVQAILYGVARSQTDERHPGCLVVQGVLVCNEENQMLHKELSGLRVGGRIALTERLKRAQAEGDLAADASPENLARYLNAVISGMAIEAIDGASYEDLCEVVALVLKSWPRV
ncbi:TetR/AcrR family transcriptional regulator [bacterium]|nr:MAG: TetR/AcrR family transcriptional regulator [bacterium]